MSLLHSCSQWFIKFTEWNQLRYLNEHQFRSERLAQWVWSKGYHCTIIDAYITAAKEMTSVIIDPFQICIQVSSFMGLWNYGFIFWSSVKFTFSIMHLSGFPLCPLWMPGRCSCSCRIWETTSTDSDCCYSSIRCVSSFRQLSNEWCHPLRSTGKHATPGTRRCSGRRGHRSWRWIWHRSAWWQWQSSILSTAPLKSFLYLYCRWMFIRIAYLNCLKIAVVGSV